MKNIVKVIFSICLLFIIGLLSILFLFSKNNKVLKKPVKLNYDLTYEEAFPDKEFRRLILTMLFRNKEYVYNGANYYYYNNFYGSLKYTNLGGGISNDSALDDNGLETFSKKKIDKNLLDQVKIIHANKEAETFKKISSLQGIEYFPNLQVLAISGTKLKEADFSNNLELETLFLPEQFYDSSGNSNITGASLLEKINVKNNSKLVNLVLNLNPNKENNIDLSGNPKLKSVFIEKSNLKSIDLTNKPYLEESNINLKGNRLQEIKSDKTNPHFTFGSTDQVIKLTVDKLEKVKISLKVNNKDLYLNDSPDFTRDNDTYTFNKVGVYTYSFYDNSSLYGGTVEVTVLETEASKFTPILNNNYVSIKRKSSWLYYDKPWYSDIVNEKIKTSNEAGKKLIFSKFREHIINLPDNIKNIEILKFIDENKNGLQYPEIKITFSDNSSKIYKILVRVIETEVNFIDRYDFLNLNEKYLETENNKIIIKEQDYIKNNKISLNIMKVYQHLYSPDIEMDSHENRYNKCNFNQSTCYEMNFFDNLYEANNIDGSISGLKDRGIILDSYINPRRFNPKFSGLDGKGNPYINPEWKVLEEERIIEIKKINIEDNSSITVQTITILRDTDGDGIPDKEDDDDDNDGISDAQEAIDGTNPKDKNDFKVKKICYKINA